MTRICSECEFRVDVHKGKGVYPECSNTRRKQNGIPLKIKTAPSWCAFKKKARSKRKSSPRAMLVKELDLLVREVCLSRANHKCELSGKGNVTLHAHHVISRSNYRVRWNPDNLVALTAGNHTLGLFSAHKNPIEFLDIMVQKRGHVWLKKLQHEAWINAGVAKHSLQDLKDIKAKLEGELNG